mmetsp:Transcript_440/g.921  ORF Transcript_440/g.921 Transcript_440/m.921 type:complete len:101 (+) Transcript_440:131-433(+)
MLSHACYNRNPKRKGEHPTQHSNQKIDGRGNLFVSSHLLQISKSGGLYGKPRLPSTSSLSSSLHSLSRFLTGTISTSDSSSSGVTSDAATSSIIVDPKTL